MIDVQTPAAGRKARRERRRRRRRVAFGTVVVLAILAALGVAASRVLLDRPVAEQPRPVTTSTIPVAEQETLLLVRHAGEQGPAQGITLLATGPAESFGMALFVPVGTLAEIPGFGLERLGQAHQYGGPPLVEASVESLLGIDVDHVAAVSNSALGALLERSGGLELELEERLVARAPDGSADVRFETGRQFLDGPRLAELWRFRERGEPELATFARQQLIWEALLDAAADEDVAAAVFGDGVPQLATESGPKRITGLFEGLVRARAADGLSFSLLPVQPFGGDGDERTYRLDEQGAARLIDGPLEPSVPLGGGSQAIRIQILNGVGTPGIGSTVDRALEGSGFRTVLTENARSFDYADTLILVYDDSDRSLRAAQRVQELLGVGTIQLSRQPQSVVDLTIVVGADFQPAEPDSGADDGTDPEEQTS